MKTPILILLLALAGCAKKRTCQCQVTETYPEMVPPNNFYTTKTETYTFRQTYDKVTKKYAKDECSNRKTEIGTRVITYTGCKLR